MNDDFFIGYLPQVPAGTRKVMRRAIILLFVVAVLLGALVVFGQSRLTPTFFEFTKTTEFTGTLIEHPYPTLQNAKPESAGQSAYVLVAPGKFGANALAAGFDGALVRLIGKKIYRNGLAMIELAPGSIQRLAAAPAFDSAAVLGDELTLTGEIVDSKCYYGVMNPGEGKVHRDCAARCLSGGVPPSFVARGGARDGTVYLLTDASGARFRPSALLDKVGESVTIRGREYRSSSPIELRVASIERLP
jgi:hypothetical protein